MVEEAQSGAPVIDHPQSMTNDLVRVVNQLQKWTSAQTPLDNPYQISYTQVSMLYLIRYGLNTPGVIAKSLKITPRAVTSHVDVLESKALLQRSIDPVDRRRTILTLTGEGTALSEHIEATALTSLSEYIQALDAQEYAALEATLAGLKRFLETVGVPIDTLIP